MSANKNYMGDSVYADFDGHDIILTTENGTGAPSNEIVIEPEVFQAIQEYVVRIREAFKGEQA